MALVRNLFRVITAAPPFFRLRSPLVYLPDLSA
jgi:hypothetical protein